MRPHYIVAAGPPNELPSAPIRVVAGTTYPERAQSAH